MKSLDDRIDEYIIISAKEGQYTYDFVSIIKKAKYWWNKYLETDNTHDFYIFKEWVDLLKRLPQLKDVKTTVKFEIPRGYTKIIGNYLDILQSDYNKRHFDQLQRDYSTVLSWVYALKYHIVRNDRLPKIKGKTILVQLLDDNVLGIKWSGDKKWVEVRGGNYQHYNPKDPLHQLIDKITGNISDLMNGEVIAISPQYSEYDALKQLLEEKDK